MKRVTFKIAKALKDAGYPQEGRWYYSPDGSIGEVVPDPEDYLAPTYLEIWLWLWREKGIKIDITTYFDSIKGYKSLATILCYKYTYSIECSDPEETIKSAIEYLCNNDLIK